HVKGAPDDLGGDDVSFQHLNHQVDDDDVKHHFVGDAQRHQYGGNRSEKGAQIGNDVEQGHQGGQEKRIGKADHQITDVGQNSHRQTDQQLPPDVISQRLVDVPQHAQDLLPPVSGKKADEGTFDHLGILQHVIHQKGNDQRQKQLVKGGPQSRHEVADAVGDGLFQPVQGFFDSRP